MKSAILKGIILLHICCSVGIAQDTTYLNWPYLGWQQAYLYTDSYGEDFLEITTINSVENLQDGGIIANGKYKSKDGILYRVYANSETVLFDFTVTAGDTIFLQHLFDGPILYLVESREKVFDPILDREVWQVNINTPQGWGATHVCTQHHDKQRIYTSSWSSLNCNFVFGTDADHDGYSNHNIEGDNTLVDHTSSNVFFAYMQLRCDTIALVSQYDELVIGSGDENSLPLTIQPIAIDLNAVYPYSFEILPEVFESYEAVYYSDLDLTISGVVRLYDCIQEDCDDNDPTINVNLNPPLITKEADDLILNEADPELQSKIQAWLNLNGNAECAVDCGNYEWSHDYDNDYSVGNHWVRFVATSDQGIVSEEEVALLSIQLASAVEEEWMYADPLMRNLVDGQLTIEGVGHFSRMKLITVGGVLINESKILSNVLSVEISHLKPGIYFVELIDEVTGNRHIERVMIGR